MSPSQPDSTGSSSQRFVQPFVFVGFVAVGPFVVAVVAAGTVVFVAVAVVVAAVVVVVGAASVAVAVIAVAVAVAVFVETVVFVAVIVVAVVDLGELLVVEVDQMKGVVHLVHSLRYWDS